MPSIPLHRTRGGRLLLGSFALLAVIGVLRIVDDGTSWWLVLSTLAALALFARGWFVGVVARGDTVIVRGFTSNRRVRSTAIPHVEGDRLWLTDDTGQSVRTDLRMTADELDDLLATTER